VISVIVKILCGFQWNDLILDHILCCGLFPYFFTRSRRAWLSGACCCLRFLFGPLVLVDVQSILELVLGFRVPLVFVFSASLNR
jgi:hypothetical protein